MPDEKKEAQSAYGLAQLYPPVEGPEGCEADLNLQPRGPRT